MRNFYQQGPPPMRPYQQQYGPRRMPNYGYPPPNRYHPGMVPPGGPKGTNKIESFMETCNRFLATAQGFQPYIAQATPLIRNLPAIWRLYRGFSSGNKGKGDDHGLDHDDESSEYNLDSSSFEYVYKDDDQHRKQKHASKQERTIDEKQQSEKTIKHKYEREHREEINHKRGGDHFVPVRHERKREQEVVKIARPQKTKPSVPRIFQPPHHFDN